MTYTALFFLISSVLGGLALFIFGMDLMTNGLRQAAGQSLRTILSRATRNRFSGIFMGIVLGTLVQSSAATVMLVGFINAGLMTLVESIPPMLGANIGTTLSMQLISFKLSNYALFAIAIGFILRFAVPHPKYKHIGQSILGFGLIFLGMSIMSDAIKPHRETFAQLLNGMNSDTTLSMFKGMAIVAAITFVIQSSGAVVGMCFALFSAGVFTSVEQAFPIILGARIGTCATALLGSIGTNIQARRSAVSHLLFNISTSALFIFIAPWLLRWFPATVDSQNLIRQTANLNTLIACIGAGLFLCFSPFYARIVVWVVHSRRAPPQPSFLDKNLIIYPEKAIYAAIQELQRVTRICAVGLRLSMNVLLNPTRTNIRYIKLNEQVIDDIKLAMRDYLFQIGKKALSRRQSILVQHIDRCMADIERIGDHIDEVCDVSIKRHKTPGARFNKELLDVLFQLYHGSENVLKLVVESLDPENKDFRVTGEKILDARDEYLAVSIQAKADFSERIANHEFPPIIGIFFSEYVTAFDRIVRHAKMVALAEKQADFWIKRKKLKRKIMEPASMAQPETVDIDEYIERLHGDDYFT